MSKRKSRRRSKRVRTPDGTVDLKDFIKSFGRVPTPPPTRWVDNKRGKGSYKRGRVKRDTLREVREALTDL